MFDDRRRFFVVDNPGSFDYEFLGIILELVENGLLNTLENGNDRLAGKPRFGNQLSDKIIFYASAYRRRGFIKTGVDS